MAPISNINALIIDMDGVLWQGSTPLPGLNEFFSTIRALRLPFILATNNASLTLEQYIDKLEQMQVRVQRSEILTSGMATAHYLAQQHDPDSTRVFVIGESGAKLPLLEQGFTLTDIDDIRNDKRDSGADIVVCGLDRELSWDKLATAALNIRAGALFIGTNGDVTLPTERGFAPGNGATLAALEAATGVKPTVIGKPEPIMYQQAMAILGTTAAETIAIGDRLDTDILGAVRADMRSLMVLSGISSQQDIATVDYEPTWVMQDIREVTEMLKQ
ncbi:HAD-IIA family hydrolase [Methylomarinum vadi]|uniref:HAD-IIA family hydrolase n=1 Tax=Methylomarinum vadi TaxID=438855 RepID=UPI0004DF6BF3|nr:HAD-IIA family hydrolase [Methylomarinum vadi]